jgi:hypothetical protein
MYFLSSSNELTFHKLMSVNLPLALELPHPAQPAGLPHQCFRKKAMTAMAPHADAVMTIRNSILALRTRNEGNYIFNNSYVNMEMG